MATVRVSRVQVTSTPPAHVRIAGVRVSNTVPTGNDVWYMSGGVWFAAPAKTMQSGSWA